GAWAGSDLPAGGPLLAATVNALRADAHLLREAGDGDTADSVDASADSIDGLPDGLPARVYLRDGLTPPDLARVRSTIEAIPGLTVTGYESKEQAFERFQRLFRDLGPFGFLNPLPEDVAKEMVALVFACRSVVGAPTPP